MHKTYMDKLQTELVTNDGRLKLTLSQMIDHYFIVVFLLFIPGLTIHSLYQMYVTETYDGVRSATELTLSSIPFIVLAIVFVFIQRNALKFTEVLVDYDEHKFCDAVNLTVGQLKWKIERNDNKMFRAYRQWNWSASWGEMVTIIKKKDRLLINSICDPNRMSSVTSWGWNKRNIETFKSNLLSKHEHSSIDLN